MLLGTPCKHYDKNSRLCKIYEQRPRICRNEYCPVSDDVKIESCKLLRKIRRGWELRESLRGTIKKLKVENKKLKNRMRRK